MSEPTPVAIITGAGAGIGRATAPELAGLGYHLALAARNPHGLEVTIHHTGVTSDTCLSVPTDVTDPAQVDRLVRKTLDRFGRIDAIVNNAGLAPVRKIPEMSVVEW